MVQGPRVINAQKSEAIFLLSARSCFHSLHFACLLILNIIQHFTKIVMPWLTSLYGMKRRAFADGCLKDAAYVK